MRPEARVQAAIEVLDRILSGTAAEPALSGWGRAHRFAGSKDRAAIRDLVFTALRRRRSYVVRGGLTGRGLMLGHLREAGPAPETVFTGEGHAPAPLTEGESRDPGTVAPADARDMPDWVFSRLQSSLGDKAEVIAQGLRDRAPVTLRVALNRTTREAAAVELAAEGIVTTPVEDVKTALQVTDGERKVVRSAAYREGRVELQDASSQAACLEVPITQGDRVLDYCAGGGGKGLALAARMEIALFAHDADPGRMADLPARAARAGTAVTRLDTRACEAQAPFDRVICDVPCSGSGTWRRTPEMKWRLTPEALDRFCQVQAEILRRAADLVRPGGTLSYMTCSLFDEENDRVINDLLDEAHGFRLVSSRSLHDMRRGDGFFVAHLERR